MDAWLNSILSFLTNIDFYVVLVAVFGKFFFKRRNVMREKDKKEFNPVEFEKFVRTWAKVKMKKDLNCKPLPSGFVKFKKEFDDDVMDVLDFKTGISIKQCFCGKNPHTEDCLTWPHVTLTLLDPNFQQVCIHSLWLEPVEFNEDVKTQSMEIEEISPGITSVISNDITTIMKDPRIIFANPAETFVREKYVWISVTKNAGLQILDIDEICNSDFVFDEKAQEWLFNNLAGRIGEIVPVDGNNQSNGFEVVMRGEKDSLLSLFHFFGEISKRTLKNSIKDRIDSF